MELTDQIERLSKKVTQRKENIQTEEATKQAFIMPFISALGYDVFNPDEVIPEYVADIGVKKDEKIDYCIKKGDEPEVMIECKHWQANLQEYIHQLHRYFYATSAKLVILTNGIQYRFYTDSEQKNIMDNEPFWEFDIINFSKEDIEELEKYRKDNFDINEIYKTANDLKITKQIKQIIKKEINNPSDNFGKFFAEQIHFGTLTEEDINHYKEIVKKSLNQLISERVQDYSATEIHTKTTKAKDYKKKSPDVGEASSKSKTNSKQTAPKEIIIGNDSYSIGKWKEVLTKTAEWLIERGKLKPSDCPISKGRSNKRNLVHTTPVHQHGRNFKGAKQLSNGVYIETHLNRTDSIECARQLLQEFGYQGELLEVKD